MKSNKKTSNPLYHVLFWVIITAALTLIFGRSWKSPVLAFYYIGMLLPIVMATSYFFNYVLVPRFLLTKKYFWFFLYLIYTLVISVYLETLVMTFSFIYLVKFQLADIAPNARDILFVTVIIYLVVFAGSFILMTNQWLSYQHKLAEMLKEQEKQKQAILEVTTNRKKAHILLDDILYIESLGDYIQFHTRESQPIRCKDRISLIEQKLPSDFIRVHRSFLVNRQAVTSFGANEIVINEQIIPIGRSYKANALQRLNDQFSISNA